MILRVFALFSTNADRCDKNILDDFLNYALVNYIMLWDDKRWETEKTNFFIGMENTVKIFGDNAFRKLDNNKESKLPINKTIFEIQVYLLGSNTYTEDQIKNLIKNKDEVLKFTEQEMRENKQFLDSISSNTGSDSSFYIRKKKFEEIFSKFVG